MSRGPGRLQRYILATLEAQGGELWAANLNPDAPVDWAAYDFLQMLYKATDRDKDHAEWVRRGERASALVDPARGTSAAVRRAVYSLRDQGRIGAGAVSDWPCRRYLLAWLPEHGGFKITPKLDPKLITRLVRGAVDGTLAEQDKYWQPNDDGDISERVVRRVVQAALGHKFLEPALCMAVRRAIDRMDADGEIEKRHAWSGWGWAPCVRCIKPTVREVIKCVAVNHHDSPCIA